MFKVLVEGCEPKRATKYSAYVDLYAREDVTIGAGETKIVPLGVKIDLEKIAKNNYFLDKFCKEHYLEIAIRSSLAVKGLIIANGSGKVDLDYPDEIGIILHNPITKNNTCLTTFQGGHSEITSMSGFIAKKGDKVAQCTLIKHRGYLMGYESEEERVGGFGSTGDK